MEGVDGWIELWVRWVDGGMGGWRDGSVWMEGWRRWVDGGLGGLSDG